MRDDSSDDLQLAPATPEQWLPALSLLFQDLPAADRVQRVTGALSSASQSPPSLGNLLVASRKTELVAALWGQVMPGKTALVWGPSGKSGEDAATAKQLVDLLVCRLATQHVQIAQALPASQATAELLARCGFGTSVELLYLAAQVDSVATPSAPSALRFVPYRPELRPALAQVIEATYDETQDAPQLNGRRDITDIIEGYMHTGDFHPERWWLIHAHDDPVGCLLLTDHPARGHFELVYMGLVPAVRGRGWGKRIVEHAQRQTARAGRSHLILAVDATNDPAIRIYTRAGFQPVHRQVVRIKFLLTDQS